MERRFLSALRFVIPETLGSASIQPDWPDYGCWTQSQRLIVRPRSRKELPVTTDWFHIQEGGENTHTHTHTHPHTHTSQQHVTTSRRNLRTNLLISATIFRRCVCVCVCLAFCFVSFRLNALAGSLNHLEMLHKQIPIYTHTEKGRICQHN